MYTHSNCLPSFSLEVFVFFRARKICKETTLSDSYQKYEFLTISILHKADLPSNFPGIITELNVSHSMYTIYLYYNSGCYPSGSSSSGLSVQSLEIDRILLFVEKFGNS